MAEKETICPLLWTSSGGQISNSGALTGGGPNTVGLCSRPYDCTTCDLMAGWVAFLTSQGWECTWLCPGCTSKKLGGNWFLPGYYSEGICGNPSCPKPQMQVGDEIDPPGFSKFLQLAIRRR